jgi:lipopolysaccharide biosynthesis glycosyltransferase
VYLDCDILIQTDVAKLFSTELGSSCLAAVIDPNYEIRDEKTFTTYFYETLKLTSLTNYVNSGILIFNIEAIEQRHLDKILELAKTNCGPFPDQDVLNAVFEDQIHFLNPLWNVFWGLDFERYKMRGLTDVQIDYLLAHAFIIHYAGEKPVQRPNHPLGQQWINIAAKHSML